MPSVHVEFLGIPRLRAGVDAVDVDAAYLTDLLELLGRRYAAFSSSCLKDGQLRSDFLCSINGKRFVRDGRTKLSEGDCVLILSADVGG